MQFPFFGPDTLNYSTTYYWRVDASNAAGTYTTGDVWSFSTAPASQIAEGDPVRFVRAVTLYNIPSSGASIVATAQEGEKATVRSTFFYQRDHRSPYNAISNPLVLWVSVLLEGRSPSASGQFPTEDAQNVGVPAIIFDLPTGTLPLPALAPNPTRIFAADPFTVQISPLLSHRVVFGYETLVRLSGSNSNFEAVGGSQMPEYELGRSYSRFIRVPETMTAGLTSPRSFDLRTVVSFRGNEIARSEISGAIVVVPPVVLSRIIGVSGDMTFGNVAVGVSAQRELSISNSGTTVLSVTSISYPVGFSGNWAAGSISAGGSQNVIVTFAPATAGLLGGIITVNADQTSGTTTIAASGTGTVVATRIVALSGNLNFGDVPVGSSANRTITITNSGNSPLDLQEISLPNGFASSWTGGLIAAGGSQNSAITFSPAAAGLYSGSVTLLGNQTSGGNTLQISGTGTALPAPLIATSVANLTLTLTEGELLNPQIFTIRNRGTGTLNYTLSTNGSPWMNVNPASGTSQGEAQVITLQFSTAAMNAGNYQGALSITDGSAANSPTTIPVLLTVHPAPFSISNLVVPSSGPVLVEFNGRAGVSYTLQRSGNLNLWENVATLLPQATGPAVLQDTRTRLPGKDYYRIQR